MIKCEMRAALFFWIYLYNILFMLLAHSIYNMRAKKSIHMGSLFVLTFSSRYFGLGQVHSWELRMQIIMWTDNSRLPALYENRMPPSWWKERERESLDFKRRRDTPSRAMTQVQPPHAELIAKQKHTHTSLALLILIISWLWECASQHITHGNGIAAHLIRTIKQNKSRLTRIWVNKHKFI